MGASGTSAAFHSARITGGGSALSHGCGIECVGDKRRPRIERHFPIFIFGLFALAVAGIVVATKIF